MTPYYDSDGDQQPSRETLRSDQHSFFLRFANFLNDERLEQINVDNMVRLMNIHCKDQFDAAVAKFKTVDTLQADIRQVDEEIAKLAEGADKSVLEASKSELQYLLDIQQLKPAETLISNFDRFPCTMTVRMKKIPNKMKDPVHRHSNIAANKRARLH